MIIFHNQVCGTSNKVLDYLQSVDDSLEIRNYIINPPTVEELVSILTKMNASAIDIVRKTDKIFIEKFKDKVLSEQEWIQAMTENPSIIQRPIVISDTKAWLARPAEEYIEKGFN